MRKIYVELTVPIIIRADEGVEVSDIIDAMELDLVSNTEGAEIEDATVDAFEVTDSK